jgi:hypothetical protein
MRWPPLRWNGGWATVFRVLPNRFKFMLERNSETGSNN